MRRRILLAALILTIAVAVVYSGGNKEKEAESEGEPITTEESQDGQEAQRIAVDDVVARVDGIPISRGEFDKVMSSNISRFEQQNQQPFAEEYRPQLERQVLDGLITRALLEREANELGIEISDDRLDETLAQFKSQFPNESAYKIALEQEGFTEDEFLTELRRQMTIEELINRRVYDSVEVTEESMRSFYDGNPQYFQRPEQVTARHIILTTEGITDESELRAKRDELAEIRREIVNGADFAEVAKERSEGPSASNGGQLGQFGRGQMVPAFEEAAFALEPGEVSDIVETQFGYHIIEVLDKTSSSVESYEEAKENIRSFLTEQERNVAAQHYLADLRKEAEIVELIEIDIPTPPQPSAN